jgi:HD superfamily phosphohydrolase
MYSQVYWHPIRRIYDIHLQDFLAADLAGGKFPTDLELHLRMTDNEVNLRIL